MNSTILVSVSLLIFLVIPASAQVPASHIVINELDTNPPGNDLESIIEWVELYNPTDSSVDISGWEIEASAPTNKTLSIPGGTIIEPGQFLRFSHQSGWFADTSVTVELRDDSSTIVDATPLFADLRNDATSWQRIYDGLDFDSDNDWKFATATEGSSNGDMSNAEKPEITVLVTSDKPMYLFGDTATLSGSVSEQVHVGAPYFHEPIVLTITGPDYKKTEQHYPDSDNKFETTMNLYKVLGVNEGTYAVLVSYSDATYQTTFTVDNKLEKDQEPIKSGMLSLLTDKSEYTPGEIVKITGQTDKVIPLEGLKFQISDPNGSIIASGNLFPTGSKFATTIFMTTVDPKYGTYEITGTYFDQMSTRSFELIADAKDDAIISLHTDKKAYGLGETVTITGRLNSQWADSLDVEILQAKNIALDSVGGSVLKILDAVRPAGDGKFEYTFSIPDGAARLGDYTIKISKDGRIATKSIVVVEDPTKYTADEPIVVLTDKTRYGLGDKMIISGKIAKFTPRPDYEITPVKLAVTNNDGVPIKNSGLPENTRQLYAGGKPTGIEFIVIPDSFGRFSLETYILPTVYPSGNYSVKATYQSISQYTVIDIVDASAAIDVSVSTDKNIYGLDETVHLTGTLPPRGENTVTISLTKPDGTVINSGANVDRQKFSWQWQTPISERYQPLKGTNDRSVVASNLGVYKINVSSGTFSQNILFKVSANPEDSSFLQDRLVVSSEKPDYEIGEKLKVFGTVTPREQGREGLVIPDLVRITVISGQAPYNQIYEATVFPNQSGYFESTFELPRGVFTEGKYKIKATYPELRAESTFNIINLGADGSTILLLSADKQSYHQGQLVTITGEPNKPIQIEKYDISVIKKSETVSVCGSLVCGIQSVPPTSVTSTASGLLSYEFRPDNSHLGIGTYEIIVDAGFDTKSIVFDVLPKPPEARSEPVISTIIEKANRIPDSKIIIQTTTKLSKDGITMNPRVVSGSLLTPMRSDQSTVNLMVSSESGTCIIGPHPGCHVQDSTRKPGSIYDIVRVDGITLKVRYSGPDAQLERFDIVPQDSGEFLPDAKWSIDVLKDDQASKFYYKINYRIIQ